jgi:hypothetical protein
MPEEIVKPAFAGRDRPLISHGVPYPEAASRHLRESFQASRVYVICSGTLGRTTDVMKRLSDALGQMLVGHRIGMTSHTLWSEVLQITEEARAVDADAILTVGAGSLTDGAKIVALVSINFLACSGSITVRYFSSISSSDNDVQTLTQSLTSSPGPRKRYLHPRRARNPCTGPQ